MLHGIESLELTQINASKNCIYHRCSTKIDCIKVCSDEVDITKFGITEINLVKFRRDKAITL